MLKWRPYGWKTDKKTLDIPQGIEPQTTLCRHCVYMTAQAEYSFEAGADAMLEALKKSKLGGIKVELWDEVHLIINGVRRRLDHGKNVSGSCWIVLIEEKLERRPAHARERG